MPVDYSLYLIADLSVCSPTELLKKVEIAVQHGVTCVQLRAKNQGQAVILETAKQLLKLLSRKGIPLIINDHLDIALAINADGIHLGQSDVPPTLARKKLGENKIIGLSINNLQQAKKALTEEVDYFGVGPIFPTKSKTDASPAMGIAAFQAIKKQLNKPVVAIGGINKSNKKALNIDESDGIAVISAILNQEDTQLATQALKAHGLPTVLTIAGSDSSGGAGIQADIKAISATGSYAASVITALTAQNTQGVQAIMNLSADFVTKQLESVFSDIYFDAIKIGMLSESHIIYCIQNILEKQRIKHIVLDPVMVATSGDSLLAPEAENSLRKLLPLAFLITPNLAEAERLSARKINCLIEQEKVAMQLGEEYQTNVLIKGGHQESQKITDILYDYSNKQITHLSTEKIHTHNTHGTGCTLSAAIASYLAQGFPLLKAVKKAKFYLTQAIASGARQTLGQGIGPVDHFYFQRSSGYALEALLNEYSQKLLNTEFINALCIGRLSEKQFLAYLQQDSLFLNDFSKALCLIAGKMEEQSGQQSLITHALSAISEEKKLQEKYLHKQPKAEKNLACFAYTEYLLRQANSAPSTMALACIVPCFILYSEIAPHLSKSLGSPKHPYHEWAALYLAEAYHSASYNLLELLKNLIKQETGQQQEKILAAFEQALKFEILFHDSIN